jgi:serine/threonine protein kinase
MSSCGSLASESESSYHGGVPKQYKHLRNKEFELWEIPPWEVEIDTQAVLGRGEFGVANLAEWRGTSVVAKVAHQSPKAAALLEREFSTMAQLHHPNVVQFLGYTVGHGSTSIVMEWMPGGNLRQLLTFGFLTRRRKLAICCDIMKAVAYFHGRRPMGIIHRDLKPENILLTSSGKAKVSDFGISRMVGWSGDVRGNTGGVGTKRYMAPEVSDGSGEYGWQADIWSCGQIFFEVLGHRHPLVKQMLSRVPENRPSALSVLRELEKIKKWWHCITF